MNNNSNFSYKSKNNSINLEELFWFSKEELIFFSLSKRNKYKKILIPKRNWKIRKLHSPVYKLKVAQRIILKSILYKEIWRLLTENITWFIPWKNIKDNAKSHIWKKYILKLDIKDFFPSITQDRVFWLFRTEFNLDYSTSMYLSGLSCYNNQLPQWAPTSPILANLIARFLDYKIIWLLKSYNSNNNKLNLTYTRYADDLTFSFNYWININLLIDYIISIMLEEWFFPNYDKIHLISSWKMQKVTWIVVNDKISVWRKYYKKFKSIFYNISKNWFELELEKWNNLNSKKIDTIEKFQHVLLWHLSFIKSISPDYYYKLNSFNLNLDIWTKK